MRVRLAHPRTVDPDDAQVEIESGLSRDLGHLPARARRAVHPDDRPTVAAAELGETEPAPRRYLNRALQARRREQIRRQCAFTPRRSRSTHVALMVPRISSAAPSVPR